MASERNWCSDGRTPDGCGTLELVKLNALTDTEGAHAWPANRLGFRHMCFEVNDLDSIANGLRVTGNDTVGEVRAYKDIYRLRSLCSPEGLRAWLAIQEVTAFVYPPLRRVQHAPDTPLTRS